MRFAVIIPAAGRGSRSGRDIPKQYVEILGKPILTHTLRAFSAIRGCEQIIVAVDDAWREMAEQAASGIAGVQMVTGGSERQHSIARALAVVAPEIPIILVHDAARPALSGDLIRRVVAGAAEFGAVVPVMPLSETVKRVDNDGVILETIPRQTLRLAQTPQGFRREILVNAYESAARLSLLGTDDASLVEATGVPVRVIPGEAGNIKVTIPEDFEGVERWLRGGGEGEQGGWSS